MADNRQATARMPRVLRFAAHPPYFGRSLRALLSLLPISPGAPLRSAHTRHASPRASLRRDHEPHNRMPDPAEASADALHPVHQRPAASPCSVSSRKTRGHSRRVRRPFVPRRPAKDHASKRRVHPATVPRSGRTTFSHFSAAGPGRVFRRGFAGIRQRCRCRR